MSWITPAAFISKWRHVQLTERSASHQHFLDLCEVLEHPKPAEADPAGEYPITGTALLEVGRQGVEFAQRWREEWTPETNTLTAPALGYFMSAEAAPQKATRCPPTGAQLANDPTVQKAAQKAMNASRSERTVPEKRCLPHCPVEIRQGLMPPAARSPSANTAR